MDKETEKTLTEGLRSLRAIAYRMSNRKQSEASSLKSFIYDLEGIIRDKTSNQKIAVVSSSNNKPGVYNHKRYAQYQENMAQINPMANENGVSVMPGVAGGEQTLHLNPEISSFVDKKTEAPAPSGEEHTAELTFVAPPGLAQHEIMQYFMELQNAFGEDGAGIKITGFKWQNRGERNSK